jgi:hypothetical protein
MQSRHCHLIVAKACGFMANGFSVGADSHRKTAQMDSPATFHARHLKLGANGADFSQTAKTRRHSCHFFGDLASLFMLSRFSTQGKSIGAPRVGPELAST